MLLIGKPYEFKIEDKERYGFTKIIEFTSLFPFIPDFIEARGEGIRNIDTEFSYYFDSVKSWNRHLKNKTYFDFIISSPDERKWAIQKIVRIEDVQNIMQKIATTVSGHPIAFVLYLGHSIAKVVYLPETTKIPVSEGIKLILQYRYGCKIESELPGWVESFKLPMQKGIEDKISDLDNKKIEIDKKIESLSIGLKEFTKFQKLLYETGTILEETVYDALRLIGATINRTEKSQDDGLLKDPFDRRYTLEIKGLKKSAATKDIRQLEDWRDRAELNGWKGKGLLIVNVYRETPLKERGVPFPDDCVKKARSEEICLLTTTQLFKALQTFQMGKFDKKDFWDAIYKSNGICDLPELF